MSVRTILRAVTLLCLLNHISHWLFKSAQPPCEWAAKHSCEYQSHHLSKKKTRQKKLQPLLRFQHADTSDHPERTGSKTNCRIPACFLSVLRLTSLSFPIWASAECSISCLQSGVTNASLLFAKARRNFLLSAVTHSINKVSPPIYSEIGIRSVAC